MTDTTSKKKEPPFREKYSGCIILVLFLLLACFTFVSHFIFAIPLCIFLIWFGYDIFLVGYQGFTKAFSVKSWGKVRAVCEKCNVIRGRDRVGQNVGYWFLDIEYRYEVDGESYKGTNYNWIGLVGSERKIDKTAKNLGSQFDVYVNPHDHSESVVIAHVTPAYFLGMAIGISVSFSGVWGLCEFFGFTNIL